ncbi:MAG: hypothetical protein ABIJ75_04655 [Actinomycetota bacterium]
MLRDAGMAPVFVSCVRRAGTASQRLWRSVVTVRRVSILALGVALALGLAACGGGGTATTTTTATTVAGDAASVTEAVVAALATDIGETSPFDAASAGCVALGAIDAVGLDRMVSVTAAAAADAGLGDPTLIFGQMTDGEIPLMMTVVEGCVDIDSAVPAVIEIFGFTTDVAVCAGPALVADGFGETIMEAFVVGSDPTIVTGFNAAFVDALAGPCADATRLLLVDDLVIYGVSTESATCAADAFGEADNFAEVVTVWMGIPDETVDTTAINDQMTQALIDCLTDDELVALGIDTGAETTVTTTTQP